MECGVAFKKSVGDAVDENLIEKTFIPKQKDSTLIWQPIIPITGRMEEDMSSV